MRTRFVSLLFAVVIVAGLTQGSVAGQEAGGKKDGKLIVYGDLAIFLGPGPIENCTLRNRYKRGEPVGFRMTAVDPQTGQHVEPTADLVVHLNYAGKTQDVKMRWRATATQPERTFWVAKWVVPSDAPTGIVRFTVTAKDQKGRTGEFKPFDVEASQLTIIE
jgi:hypothetical protein